MCHAHTVLYDCGCEKSKFIKPCTSYKGTHFVTRRATMWECRYGTVSEEKLLNKCWWHLEKGNRERRR